MKIDWSRKITSRKFWIAIVGLVSGLILAFNGSAETVESVSGIIMSAASVIAYTIGEGLSDAASAGCSDLMEKNLESVESEDNKC